MLIEAFGFAVVTFSLGISGLIFIGIGLFLKFKCGYIGGIKTTGTLVGFLRFNNGHYIGVLNADLTQGKRKGFSRNAKNRKPIIRFLINKKTIVTHSEGSVAGLGKKDIGKTIPIRCFAINGGRAYKVIPQGKQYAQLRAKRRKITFRIFTGVGFALIAFAVLTINRHLTLSEVLTLSKVIK